MERKVGPLTPRARGRGIAGNSRGSRVSGSSIGGVSRGREGPPVINLNGKTVPTYVMNATSSVSSLGNLGRKDRYGVPNKSGSAESNSILQKPSVSTVGSGDKPTSSGSIVKDRASTYINNASNNSVSNNHNHTPPSNQSYDLPSLMSTSNTFDTEDGTIVTSDLFKKFQDAFNITLQNNPGILPGAPSIIESVQNALFKVQKKSVEKESSMRKQLEKVRSEKETMEKELTKEMGTLAMRRNEMSKELEAAKAEKERVEESLQKQLEGIQAIKTDLELKMNDATAEKEELTKHLGFLSKSRVELETALETEMQLVEKDRDSLQKVIAQRKDIQRQKNENKELESKIEIMTEAAAKEKKMLQAEVADLKTFEAHLKELKKNNEDSRRELEAEKEELIELTKTMQTKKLALMESKADFEKTMQKEIDELEAQIENTKMVHAQDMEDVVKSKVLGYLRRGGYAVGAEASVSGGRGDAVEEVIKARVEKELKVFKEKESRRRGKEEVESDDENTVGDESTVLSEVPFKSKSKSSHSHHKKCSKKQPSSKEVKLRKELDSLRDELRNNQVQAEEIEEMLAKRRGGSNAVGPRSGRYASEEDELREEIQCLRDQMKMCHRDKVNGYASPSPRAGRISFNGFERVTPAYSVRRQSPGYSMGYEDVYEQELADSRYRLGAASFSSPMMRHQSPAGPRSSGLKSRYYL